MLDHRLIEKYYRMNHLHRVDGSDQEDGISIVPFMLVDISYQYYMSGVHPVGLRMGAKRARSRWHSSQQAFMREFSSCFTPEEYSGFLDAMDELAEAVSNDLTVLQVQAMNCVSQYFDFEQQKIISSALVSNYVALLAQNIWKLTHTVADGSKHIENKNLNGILKWSRDFSEAYMNQISSAYFDVLPQHVEALDTAVAVLKRKVLAWVKANIL